MSEVIIANNFNFDDKFKVAQVDENTIRIYRFIDLPADKIELFPLDKQGQTPITGRVEVRIPLWLYMEYKEFFELK